MVDFTSKDQVVPAAWCDEALRRGYHSCAVLPIKVQNEVAGVFGVYTDQAGFFQLITPSQTYYIEVDLNIAGGSPSVTGFTVNSTGGKC